jgi:hypothetical protein
MPVAAFLCEVWRRDIDFSGAKWRPLFSTQVNI